MPSPNTDHDRALRSVLRRRGPRCTRTIYVRAPHEMESRLVELAARDGVTLSDVARRAFARLLADENP